MSQVEPGPAVGTPFPPEAAQPSAVQADGGAGFDFAVLDALPVADHPAAYADLHDRLQEALSSLDEV
ncbi:MAG: hypothetical protein ACR2KO_17895 [Geodermatophilaceae bacterium]|nr:hypothetical protein [Geodermatophilaceae bacterium]